MKLPVPVVIAATLTLGGCAKVCSDFCTALPSTGDYHVCSATPDSHVKAGDRMIIGRLGNVTNVALAYEDKDNREARLRMFQGQMGLVGLHPYGNPQHLQYKNVDHVISIARARVPTRRTGCESDDVVRVDFLWQQQDGQYRATTSDSDGAHAHGQLDSTVVPPGFE